MVASLWGLTWSPSCFVIVCWRVRPCRHHGPSHEHDVACSHCSIASCRWADVAKPQQVQHPPPPPRSPTASGDQPCTVNQTTSPPGVPRDRPDSDDPYTTVTVSSTAATGPDLADSASSVINTGPTSASSVMTRGPTAVSSVMTRGPTPASSVTTKGPSQTFSPSEATSTGPELADQNSAGRQASTTSHGYVTTVTPANGYVTIESSANGTVPTAAPANSSATTTATEPLHQGKLLPGEQAPDAAYCPGLEDPLTHWKASEHGRGEVGGREALLAGVTDVLSVNAFRPATWSSTQCPTATLPAQPWAQHPPQSLPHPPGAVPKALPTPVQADYLPAQWGTRHGETLVDPTPAVVKADAPVPMETQPALKRPAHVQSLPDPFGAFPGLASQSPPAGFPAGWGAPKQPPSPPRAPAVQAVQVGVVKHPVRPQNASPATVAAPRGSAAATPALGSCLSHTEVGTAKSFGPVALRTIPNPFGAIPDATAVTGATAKGVPVADGITAAKGIAPDVPLRPLPPGMDGKTAPVPMYKDPSVLDGKTVPVPQLVPQYKDHMLKPNPVGNGTAGAPQKLITAHNRNGSIASMHAEANAAQVEEGKSFVGLAESPGLMTRTPLPSSTPLETPEQHGSETKSSSVAFNSETRLRRPAMGRKDVSRPPPQSPAGQGVPHRKRRAASPLRDGSSPSSTTSVSSSSSADEAAGGRWETRGFPMAGPHGPLGASEPRPQEKVWYSKPSSDSSCKAHDVQSRPGVVVPGVPHPRSPERVPSKSVPSCSEAPVRKRGACDRSREIGDGMRAAGSVPLSPNASCGTDTGGQPAPWPFGPVAPSAQAQGRSSTVSQPQGAEQVPRAPKHARLSREGSPAAERQSESLLFFPPKKIYIDT